MRILWLSHFVPYPPAGGMRQRSYNLLRAAAGRHEVHLAALNQRALLPSPEDVEKSRRALEDVCAGVTVFPIPSDRSRWRWRAMAAAGFFRSSPYHENWLRSAALHRWMAREATRRSFDLVHVDTLGMAPYTRHLPGTPMVLNHHNVESHMMARRASTESNPLARVYMSREATKLERHERTHCGRAAVNLVVSRDDGRRLERVVPEVRSTVVENGVDVDYFRSREPVGHNGGGLVFTGQLSWYANLEAVRFLLSDVWPELADDGPDRRLTLAGRNPPSVALEAAENDPRIIVTGEVDDMRPWFECNSIYVCPIRTGGGTRLKVLDALAMAKPLVASSLAVEGLGLVEGEHFLRAETGLDYVEQVRRLERDHDLRRRMAEAGRTLVERRFSWQVIGEHLEAAYRAAAGEASVVAE